jgi:hypothetical protein
MFRKIPGVSGGYEVRQWYRWLLAKEYGLVTMTSRFVYTHTPQELFPPPKGITPEPPAPPATLPFDPLWLRRLLDRRIGRPGNGPIGRSAWGE